MRRVLNLMALLNRRLVVTIASGLTEMVSHSSMRLAIIDIVDCSRATRSKHASVMTQFLGETRHPVFRRAAICRGGIGPPVLRIRMMACTEETIGCGSNRKEADDDASD